jgi:hypothetical protein
MVAGYLGRDARRLRGQKKFVLRIVPDVDHTFTTLDSQALLRQAIKGYLEERFG